MKKIFDDKGTFKAYYVACKWLNDNGFSYGSSQIGGPIAIFKGDCYVSKWRNLSAKERKSVDGLLTGDRREGPITVEIYDKETK